MTPCEAFGVVVRSLGIMGWLTAAFYAVSTVLAMIWPDYRAGIAPWWHYAIAAAEFFAVGSVLLLKADSFVTLAYRRRRSTDGTVK